MGNKLAPSFANIFMGNFEEKFVYSYPLKTLIWKRFIEDIFFIWTYGDNKLQDFVTHLNNCHNTIKFTLEQSFNSANFPDITISKDTAGLLQPVAVPDDYLKKSIVSIKFDESRN